MEALQCLQGVIKRQRCIHAAFKPSKSFLQPWESQLSASE